MAKVWQIIHSYAVEKEKERLFLSFYLGSLPEEGWLNQVHLTMQHVDGHSMVSKMIIEFLL